MMIKQRYELKNGKKGVVEGERMTEVVEAGRQVCKANGVGFPTGIVLWERVGGVKK